MRDYDRIYYLLDIQHHISTRRLPQRPPHLRVSLLSNHEGLHVGGHGCLERGPAGEFGTHVVRQLHAAGHRVIGLDQIPPKDPLPEGVGFHVCDIRQGKLPDRTFDAVVHLAALAGVRPSLDRPLEYETTNVVGTIRLLEFCRSMGIRQFVFASSSSAYGPDTPLPAEESTPANPCSPYALTKLHGR